MTPIAANPSPSGHQIDVPPCPVRAVQRRILHVTPYYEDAWAYVGIPRVCASMVDAQVAAGQDVTVCTTDVCDAAHRLPAQSSDNGMDRPDKVVFRNLSNRMAWQLQFFTPVGMRRFLLQWADTFDVAHVHGYHHLPSVWAAEALRRKNVPWVLQPNGTTPRIEQRKTLKWLFDHTVGRRVLPEADLLIAVSETEKRQLQSFGVEKDRIRVVPNPVETEDFETLPRAGTLRRQLGLGDAPVIAYLGRLSPRKRLDVLLSAFIRLDERRASVQSGRSAPVLILAGADQGVQDDLRRRAMAAGVADRVHFLGLLRGDERLPLLVDADVVVYASEDEIFGLVPMEALLCETPVIVGDDSGCGEWLETLGGRDAGALLVATSMDSGDQGTEDLTEALHETLTRGVHSKQKAQQGRQCVLERFSPARIAQEISTCYEELLTGHSLLATEGLS